MKRHFASALIFLTVFTAFSASAYAASAPCEDKLAELRTEMTNSKVSEADMLKVKELEAKGVERCNADDDKRADDFFADAMKLLAK